MANRLYSNQNIWGYLPDSWGLLKSLKSDCHFVQHQKGFKDISKMCAQLAEDD